MPISEKSHALAKHNSIQFLSNTFRNSFSRQEYISSVVENLALWTGCQCVGVRILEPEGTMPYEAYVGFTKEFWESENCLSFIEHECACTRIVTGEPDTWDKPILTTCGSIYTDDLQGFAKKVPDQFLHRYRGKCIGSEFSTLAVIPIRHQAKVVGLIHIADHQSDLLSTEGILLIESLSDTIAEAINKFNVIDALQLREVELNTLKAQLQDALQVQKELLEKVFDAVPDGLCLTDANREILLVNRGMSRLYQYSEDELVGMKMATLYDQAESFEEVGELCKNLKEREGSISHIIQTRRKDGTVFSGEVTITTVLNQKSEIIGFLAIVRDVTDRLEAENIIIENRDRYRTLYREFETLVNGISDSIMLIDSDKNIVWVNQAQAKLMGASPEELVRQNYCETQCVNIECAEGCILKKVQQTGKPEHNKLNAADGTVWGRRVLPIINDQGDVIRFLCLKNDITERVKLEQEAGRMKQLASLGELSAGIAHEINNPTGVILRLIKVMKVLLKDSMPVLEKCAEEDPGFHLGNMSIPEVKESSDRIVNDIRDSAQKIKRIVDDLKGFAVPEKKQGNEQLDLRKIIRKAVRLTGSFIKNSSKNFSLNLEDSVPLSRGNAQKIEQVLINLIQNACQALTSPAEAVCVKLYYSQELKVNIIEVRDEGRGIDPSDLEHVLKPFFTTRREEGGSGIGLSICNRIIEDHAGSMEIESGLGCGTLFRVLLPIEEGEY